MVVGTSGSGKTTYVVNSLKLVKPSPRIFAINGAEIPNSSSLEFKQLGKVPKNSTVVVEDLINPKNEEMAELKKLLLYGKRHHNIDVFVLLHSVTGNNTYRLLQHADFFVFTKTTSNTKSFYELASLLKLEKESEAKPIWNGFLERDEPHVYLKLDVQSRKFEIAEVGQGSSKEEAERKRKRVQTILASRGSNAPVGMALFDHIFRNFDIDLLHEDDLSVPMKSAKTGKITKVNICDLLYYMTTPNTAPTHESLSLFKELSTRFSIPTLLIINQGFVKKMK